MHALLRPTALANLAAGLLVGGALASCVAVSLADESTAAIATPLGLSLVGAALVVAGVAWRERLAKIVVAFASVALVAVAGLAAYEHSAPPVHAVAKLALTTSSLYPSEDRGAVLGQASLVDRVGVWSIAWLDAADGDEEAFARSLRRMLRISSHETGHMFSMEHCIYYRCCMNGSSGLHELDRQPLWLCPQCQAKLHHATGADPTKQLTDLITFADRHGLAAEAAFWRRSVAAMREP